MHKNDVRTSAYYILHFSTTICGIVLMLIVNFWLDRNKHYLWDDVKLAKFRMISCSCFPLYTSVENYDKILLCLTLCFYTGKLYLTLSWRRSLSYRNQFIDLLSKSMDWFLHDSDLRHERVNTTNDYHRQWD